MFVVQKNKVHVYLSASVWSWAFYEQFSVSVRG